MKRLFFLVILASVFSSCKHKSPSSDNFSYSLLPVQIGDKWGYIDKSGKTIINPQFENAYLFSDGLALVESSDFQYGYIDKSGKFVINPKYVEATHFTDGLAFVTPANSDPICIDTKGNTKFTIAGASCVLAFSDGLACVRIKNKFGFIDKEGKFVIQPAFDEASSFQEGYASVAIKKSENSDTLLYGYIDKEGKYIVNPQYSFTREFSGNRGLFETFDNKIGFVDEKGNVAVNAQFQDADVYHDDMAVIKQGDEFGFIDKNGKIAINPQFDEAESFFDGVAAVRSGDKWGYIDQNGKYVINPQFTSASHIYNNYFATVLAGDKVGFVDKKGKYIINPQFKNTFNTYLPYYNGFSSKFDSTHTAIIPTDALDMFIGTSNTTFAGYARHSTYKDFLEQTKGKDLDKLLSKNSNTVLDTRKQNLAPGINVDSAYFCYDDAIAFQNSAGNVFYNYGTSLKYIRYFINSRYVTTQQLTKILKEKIAQLYSGNVSEEDPGLKNVTMYRIKSDKYNFIIQSAPHLIVLTVY